MLLTTWVSEHTDRDIQKLQVYSSSKVTEDRLQQQYGPGASDEDPGPAQTQTQTQTPPDSTEILPIIHVRKYVTALVRSWPALSGGSWC